MEFYYYENNNFDVLDYEENNKNSLCNGVDDDLICRLCRRRH